MTSKPTAAARRRSRSLCGLLLIATLAAGCGSEPTAAPSPSTTLEPSVTLLAYRSCKPATQHRDCGIFLSRPDGTGQRLLTPHDGEPSWSPDGTRIAYTTYDRTGNSALHVIGVDSAQDRLVARTGFSGARPGWLDNQTIVYNDATAPISSHLVDRPGNALKTVHLTDNAVRAFDDTTGGGLTLSPDRSKVAYLDLNAATTTCDPMHAFVPLITRVISGSTTRRFTDTIGIPSWFPDNRRLAITMGTVSDRRCLTRVVLAQLDGTLTTVVSDGASPAVSPDGTHIAYVRRSPSDSAQLRVVTTEGTHDISVATCASVLDVSWSPDSAHLSYACAPHRGTAAAIYIINADGSQRRIATRRGDSPSWALVPQRLVSPERSARG